MRATARRSA